MDRKSAVLIKHCLTGTKNGTCTALTHRLWT